MIGLQFSLVGFFFFFRCLLTGVFRKSVSLKQPFQRNFLLSTRWQRCNQTDEHVLNRPDTSLWGNLTIPRCLRHHTSVFGSAIWHFFVFLPPTFFLFLLVWCSVWYLEQTISHRWNKTAFLNSYKIYLELLSTHCFPLELIKWNQ